MEALWVKQSGIPQEGWSVQIALSSGTDQTDDSRPILFVAPREARVHDSKLGHRRPWMPALSRA
jgi:hypothetical protein